MFNFTQKYLDTLITYDEYLKQTELFASSEQAGNLREYTKLNLQRMKRILLSTVVLPELKSVIQNISEKQTWVVISEGWCGDAANSVPVMKILADLNPLITFRIALRDTHPELMDEYLTNGTRSIPMLIMLDKDLKEIGKWGPRPAVLQSLVYDMKKLPDYNYDELKRNVQMWYLNDKTISTQTEILNLIKNTKL